MRLVKVYILALVLMGLAHAKAQQEISMYYLGNNLYQSVHLNPAFMPEKDNYSLISHYFNFSHSGFAIEDILIPEDSMYRVNIDTMLSAMNPGQNFLNVNNTFDLFSLKWKRRRNYYGFNIQEKISTTFSYPKDFFDFALSGWAPGDSLDLALGFKALHYREFSFNYMKKMKRWDLGFRVKFLQGMSVVNTKSTQAYFIADSNIVDGIRANYAYRIDMSGGTTAQSILDGGDIAANLPSYLLNFRNWGVGFDLGAQYKIDQRLKLSMSLLDLGSINWRSDLSNLTVSGNQVVEGLDLVNLVSNDSVSFGDQPQELLDSINARNNVIWTEDSFRTNIVPKHYVALQYNLIDSLMLGVVWYGEFFKGYYPAFSVGLNKQISKFINLGINYSVKNRSYTNLGGSVVMNFGPLQIYGMTDNFYSLLDYWSVKNINLRWGMNLRFRLIRPRFRPKEG